MIEGDNCIGRENFTEKLIPDGNYLADFYSEEHFLGVEEDTVGVQRYFRQMTSVLLTR